MKKMKRILSLLMTLCLLLGDVVTPAMAADLGQTEMEATEEAVVETEVRETIEETTVPEETAAPVQTEVPETEAAEPVETEIPEMEAAELEIPEVTEEALLTEEEDQEEQLKLTPETVLGGTLTEEQDEYTCTYEVPEAGTICLYLDSVAEGVTANITLTVGEEIVSPVDGTLTKELAAGSQITICITAEPAGEVKWSGTFTLAETPDEEKPVVPEETVVPFGAEGFSGEVTLTQETTEVEVSEIYEAPCDGWLTASAEAKYITANAVLVVDGKNVDQEARVKTGTRVQVRISADKIWKETEITWSVAFVPDEGTYLRPAEPESINEVSVDLESGDSDGYYYSHKATETGTYSFEVTEVTEGIDVSLKVIKNGEDQDNLGAVDVEKDDDLLIHVIADKDENDAYPAAKITWKATFTYPEGSYQNPILLKGWNVEGSGIQAELTLTDVPVGKTWYRIPNAVGMTLTINGEQSGKLPAWELGRTEAVFFIELAEETDSAYELKIFWPEGTVNNPKVLTEVSGETVTLVDGGYCYTYEVESSGAYIFSLAEGEKGDIIVTVVDDVKNVEKRLSGDGVEGNLAIQAEAGNILEILVTSDNAEITWNLTAEYAEGSKENPYQICVAKGKSVVLPAAEDWVSEDSTKAVVDKGKAKVTAKGAVGETVRLSATVDGETTWYKVLITTPVTKVTFNDGVTKDEDGNLLNLAGQSGTMRLTDGAGEMDLDAVLLPDSENVCGHVVWTSSNEEWAEVDQDGKITFKPEGAGNTVNITATAMDGSGKKGVLKIKIVQEIETLGFKKAVEIAAGKTVKLEPLVVYGPECVTNKKLTWEILGDGNNYAKVSSSGVLTANGEVNKQGTPVEIAVVCRSVANSEISSEESPCKVTIYPATTTVQLFEETNQNEAVTGKTLNVYLEDGKDKEVSLKAKNLPEKAAQSWIWTSSNAAYVSVNNPQEGTITVHGKGSGKTVTVTATAADGTNKKASVKIKIIQPVESVELPATEQVAVGKSLKLAEQLRIGPDEATNKKVKWYLVYTDEEGNRKLVNKIDKIGSVSSSGVFTADKKAESKAIAEVICLPEDGFLKESDLATCKITILPITTNVIVKQEETVVNGTTQIFLLNSQKLEFSVVNEPQGAKQDWIWTTSNKNVSVSRNSEGNFCVSFLPSSAGKTVTITATANDGSNKKATVKIKVIQPVETLSRTDGGEMIHIAKGKSQALAKKVQVDPSNVTNKKLNWALYMKAGDGSYKEIPEELAEATVKNGTLKVTRASQRLEAVVVVTPQDGYNQEAKLEIPVTIYPTAASAVKLYYDIDGVQQDLTNRSGTWSFENGGCYMVLQGHVVPENDDVCKQLVWTSSNEDYAVVEDGVITFCKDYIGKTVTITAAAVDGSGKKATLKVKLIP